MSELDRINELIHQAAEKARMETSDEPEPQYVGELTWPVKVEIGQGLEGAIAGSTKVGYVNGAKGWLIYRGFNIFDLAEKSNYEETAYLLLFGRLPKEAELHDFKRRVGEYRVVPADVIRILQTLPTARAHPMTALQTATAALGALDPTTDAADIATKREHSIKLIAQLGTLIGAIAAIRQGRAPLDPDPSLSHAADILRMMTGKAPSPMDERIMDIGLILHADHGCNASTFTCMVVNSSLSDMYSTVAAGIASLKGPLHGGANEHVLYMLDEIGSPDNVKDWYQKAAAQKRKVMGFGHRVYRAYDPRARILGPLSHLIAEAHPEIRPMWETAATLEQVVIEHLGKEKKIFPNVDYWSGIVYKALGIETKMFTPIFAASRVAGWTARVLEYLENNRIFRPRVTYTGPIKLDYVPLSER
ncbi:MAG: citrate synthase/methylcitrate synthase [Candidatus Sumerlaeia bacterium]